MTPRRIDTGKPTILVKFPCPLAKEADASSTGSVSRLRRVPTAVRFGERLHRPVNHDFDAASANVNG